MLSVGHFVKKMSNIFCKTGIILQTRATLCKAVQTGCFDLSICQFVPPRKDSLFPKKVRSYAKNKASLV